MSSGVVGKNSDRDGDNRNGIASEAKAPVLALPHPCVLGPIL